MMLWSTRCSIEICFIQRDVRNGRDVRLFIVGFSVSANVFSLACTLCIPSEVIDRENVFSYLMVPEILCPPVILQPLSL